MWTPLHVASKQGFVEIVEYLLINGAGINDLTEDGYSPLHYAAQYGNLNVTKFLVEHGATIEDTKEKLFM